MSGHHISIPPNFGGPQKYNTSFQSTSYPVKNKSNSQQPAADKDSVTGRSSSSGDSDRKGNSQYEQILSQTKEVQQHNEQVIVNHSIEESSNTNIPIKQSVKLTLEEDLFRGSPDSFFGVESVENVAQKILELTESKSKKSGSETDPGKLVGLVFEKGSRAEESNSVTDSASHRNSTHIGDPVPLNHKIAGSLNHDTEVPSSVDDSSEMNYESNFKIWPSAKDHATIPRTDSSDLLEDYPIERAVRKSVCDDDYEGITDCNSSTFKTCAMTQQRDDCSESLVEANSTPQRCSVEAVRTENSEEPIQDSMATFSLAKSSVPVIENQAES